MQTPRDENRIATLLGVSNADGTTPVTIYADPTTHRLLVGTGTVVPVYTEVSDPTYAILTTDSIIKVTAESTLTLPTAVGNTGRFFQVKRRGTGNVTIIPTGSETIDGDANYILSVNKQAAGFFSDGSNWNVL